MLLWVPGPYDRVADIRWLETGGTFGPAQSVSSAGAAIFFGPLGGTTRVNFGKEYSRGFKVRVLALGGSERLGGLFPSDWVDHEGRISLDATETFDSALARLGERPYDCVLLASPWTHEEDERAVAELHRRASAVPIIVLGEKQDPAHIVRLMRAGAVDYLVVSALRARDLLESIERTVRRAHFDAQLRAAAQASAVAERVRQERQLQIRGFFDFASVAMALVAPGGDILRTNGAFRRLTGYGLAEVAERTLLQIVLPQYRASLEAGLAHLMAAQCGAFEEEVRILHRDGSELWVSLSLAAIRDEDGKLQGYSLHVTDIRTRKETEAELQRSERRYQELLAQAPIGIFETDTHGGCRYVNDEWSALTGVSAEQALGSGWASTLHPDDRPEGVRAWLDAVRRVSRFQREFRCLRPDGSIVWVAGRAAPVLDVDGRVLGYLGSMVDITDRVLAEQQLVSAKDAAERASSAKAEFLAKMSHEIRTPMNSVIGMTELLLQTRLSRDQRLHLELVHESGKGLLRLINDILDFSRVEAHRLTLERMPFDLRQAFALCLRGPTYSARKKGVDLTLRFAAEAPRSVVGDPHRIRQILVNLVGNAVKFTDQGEILVEVDCRPAGTEAALNLSLVVSDTGPGIAVEEQQRIFKAFAQEDTGIARRFGGTGLGLTICAQLVELMGGEIRLDSEPGKGSSFHVSVLVERAKEDLLAAAGTGAPGSCGVPELWSPPPRLNGRTLLIQSNATAREVTRNLLESIGLSPLALPGPDEALAAMRLLDPAEAPLSLVIFDPLHCAQSAFAFIDQLRRDQPSVGLVCLSAGGSAGLDFGGDVVQLTKPVLVDELCSAIMAAMSPEPLEDEPLASASFPPAPPDQRMRILVAEDNTTNQLVLFTMLDRMGHSVELVRNGEQVLERLEQEHFDLLLLDLQMPVMGGIEAAERIRQAELRSGARLPILAITAQAMRADRQACLDAGMDDYLTKPLEMAKLHAALSPWQAAAQSKRVRVAEAASSDPCEPERVDLRSLQRRIGAQPSAMQMLAKLFESDSERLLGDLREEASRRAGPFNSAAAHTLKGMLRNVCAPEAARLAASLEQAIQRGDWQEVDALLPRLMRGVESIRGELGRAAQSGGVVSREA